MQSASVFEIIYSVAIIIRKKLFGNAAFEKNIYFANSRRTFLGVKQLYTSNRKMVLIY